MSSSMELQKEIKQEFEPNPIFISPESMEPDPLSTFTSLLEDNTNTNTNSITNWLADSLQTHHESFTSLLSSDPFGLPFDLGLDPLGFNAESLSFPDPNPGTQFQTTHLAESSYEALGTPQFVNPYEIFEPIEVDPEIGAQPTLFEKRKVGTGDGFKGEEEEDGSFDGSVLNCDVDENVKDLEKGKGKRKRKKGEPAKNLMAERRRRKRLNDRLCMLRSVVPRISKVRAFAVFSM